MATRTKKKLGGASLGAGGCNIKTDSRNLGRGACMRSGGRHVGFGHEEGRIPCVRWLPPPQGVTWFWVALGDRPGSEAVRRGLLPPASPGLRPLKPSVRDSTLTGLFPVLSFLFHSVHQHFTPALPSWEWSTGLKVMTTALWPGFFELCG